MGASDLRGRTVSGWAALGAWLCAGPWAGTLGWFGLAVLGVALGVTAGGLAMARRGVWGAGDAAALGVAFLLPQVTAFGLAATAVVGVALWRGRSRFPPGWAVPWAAVLAGCALPFLLLALAATT